MKAILISIQKPHTDNIFLGKKTNEWRTKPLPIGTTAYVYETKNKGGCGKVIGEVEITGSIQVDIDSIGEDYDVDVLVVRGCVGEDYLYQYAHDHDVGFLWANLIENVKRYDKPKELSEFHKPCKNQCYACEYYIAEECFNNLTRAPQSWCYVEEL